MSIDTSTTQAFTDTELLALTRQAIAQIMVGGQSRTKDGRTLTAADLGKLWQSVGELETRIQDDANTTAGGGNALVRFGETQ